jgi:hypothetical protein
MAVEQQQQQQQFAPGQSTPKADNGDLSAEIAQTIEREPGDRVRVTWVGASSYRCNWWAPTSTDAYDNPSMYGLVVTTHRVRKSRFITVTKDDGRLVIRDHSRAGGAGSGGGGTGT